MWNLTSILTNKLKRYFLVTWMPNKKYKIEKNEQFSILYVPTNTEFLKRNMLFDKILLFQP